MARRKTLILSAFQKEGIQRALDRIHNIDSQSYLANKYGYHAYPDGIYLLCAIEKYAEEIIGIAIHEFESGELVGES